MEIAKEILSILLSAVILPAIPILATYLVTALREWVKSKSADMENKTAEKYLNSITEVIFQAVVSTTQTYVDTLKAQGKFDEEAHKVAFDKTKATVLFLLTQEAEDFIAETYGDLDLWLDTKIEQIVNETKNFS